MNKRIVRTDATSQELLKEIQMAKAEFRKSDPSLKKGAQPIAQVAGIYDVLGIRHSWGFTYHIMNPPSWNE